MPTPEWTVEAAEREVRRLVTIRGLARYPTPKEFRDAGMSGMFHMITSRFGGHKAFATRLGLASPRNEWTGERVDAAIVRLVAELGRVSRYPTEREMRRCGPSGLVGAACRFGGNRARAARLGLVLRPRWDPETAAAAVSDLAERLSLDRYPTRRQFEEARATGLFHAIADQLGGHDAMAARLGLRRAYRRHR
jgi:hypothetical protein